MYTQIQEYCIKNCQSAMLTAMKRYHISGSASNISLLHDPIYLFISQPFKTKKKKCLGVLLGIEIMITNMTMFSRFGTRNNYKNS